MDKYNGVPTSIRNIGLFGIRKRGMIMQTKEKLIELLSQEDTMVLEQAYLYAKNYVKYGEDVTEKWVTATQNARALEKAYREGYYDALHKLAESEVQHDKEDM